MDKRTNFFILGAPKCGTTALAQWLGEHPDVFISPVKEPHFYSTDLKNRQARTRTEYDRLFKKVQAVHKAVGEASVWYLYSWDAVPNILAENPDAKFIVCLRNPVDMAWSLHGQQLVASNEDIGDFERAWHAQSARAEGRDVPSSCVDSRLLHYGAACKLGEQLERLYKHCSVDQVHPIFLDEIKADTSAVYRDTLTFLGLEDDGRDSFPVVNAASQRRWPMLARAVKKAGRFKRRLGVPRLGTGVMPLFDRINRKNSDRRAMSAETRTMLIDYFQEDITLLQSLISRDLGDWVRKN